MERAADKYADLIAKYLAGEIDRKEKGDLFAWVETDGVNKQFFEDMVHLWGASEEYETPTFDTNVTEAWSKVEPQIQLPNHAAKSSLKIVHSSNRFSVWRIAAVLLPLLAVGLWLWMQPPNQNLIVEATGEKEQKAIVLPDGSEVWLNENTTISYASNFEPRFVTLEGEAFFDVERLEESPFEILSGEAKTRVLGTSFNVRAISEESFIEVTVETGLVELISQKEEKIIAIEAGNSGVFSKENLEIEKTKTQIPNASSWKTLLLEFEETPMENVIQSLERHFGISIETANQDILYCNFKSSFDNPTLEIVWKTLEFNFPLLQIEQVGTIYVISGDGCPLN